MKDEHINLDSNPNMLEDDEDTYLGVVNPTASGDSDEVAELRAQLEKANHMIKTQNAAYQRAIRRAVLENDYVSKINSKLVQNAELHTREKGYSEKEFAEVKNICEDMKQLITKLVKEKAKAEEKARILTTSLAKIELAMSVQEGKVEELTSSIETAEGKTAKLESDKESLNCKLSAIRDEKRKLEEEKKGISEALAVGHELDDGDEGGAVSEAVQRLVSEKKELAKELTTMRLVHDEAKMELESLQKRFDDADVSNKNRISELVEAKCVAEKQVQDLISSVEEMEGKVAAKEDMVQELNDTIQCLEEQNKMLLFEKENLMGDVQALQHQQEALERDLEASKEATKTLVKSALDEQLAQSVGEKAEIQKQLDDFIEEKKVNDQKMGQSIEEAEEDNTRLRDSINSLMNELMLVNNEVNDDEPLSSSDGSETEKSLEAKVADNLSLISALRLKLRFSRKHNEDLQHSVAERDETVAKIKKDLDSVIEARDSEMASSASKLDEAKQTIEEEKKKYDACIAQQDAEKEKAEIDRLKITELEEQVQVLKESEKDSISSKTKLEDEIQALQYEKMSLEEKEVLQHNRIDKLEIELSNEATKIAELEVSLEDGRVEIQSVTEKLKDLMKDVESTVATARDAGADAITLEDVRMILVDDANTITQIRGQIKTLEDQKRDVEDTLLSVANDKEELEEKCESASEELKDLQEKLESAVGMGVAFVDKAERYKKDVAALSIKRDAAEKLAKEYHTENEANVAKCVELQQKITSVTAKLEEMEKESSAAIAKANERLNKRMKDCDKQLTTLFPSLHPARKDNNLKFGEMVSLLQKENRSVSANIKSLEEEIEAAQDESAILEQQVRILSKEVSKHKRQNKEMLRALNEVAVGHSEGDSDIPMDEVAADTEVERRLRKFKEFMYTRLKE